MIGAPNPAALQGQLAGLSDQQLQQFAMTNKSDAIALSMALAEKNRRQQMRASAGAQAPVGKVNDEVVASMAMPENSGIAQLPARTVQGMAGGGIVAFAQGGPSGLSLHLDDEDYSTIPGLLPGTLYSDALKVAQGEPPAQDTGPSEYGRQMRNVAQFFTDLLFRPPKTGQGAGTTDSNPGGILKPGELMAKPKGKPALKEKTPPTSPSGLAAAAAVRGVKGTGTAPTGKAAPAMSLEDFIKQQQDLADKLGAKSSKYFDPEVEALKQRRAEVDAQSAKAPYEALLRAGLGMLAGRSTNALTNIGEGAIQGFDAYAKAQQQRQAELDKMANAQISLARYKAEMGKGDDSDATGILNAYRQMQKDAEDAAYKQKYLGVLSARAAGAGNSGAITPKIMFAAMQRAQQQAEKEAALNPRMTPEAKEQRARELFQQALSQATGVTQSAPAGAVSGYTVEALPD